MSDYKEPVRKHAIWFKVAFNPILRRFFKIEICSIANESEQIVGYGIRKYKKYEF
jgi:hypothetical protein